MSGLPSRYTFKCEKCKKIAPPRAIRAQLGACTCKGESWGVEVEFEDGGPDGSNAAVNALGIASALTIGVGFTGGTGDRSIGERVFLNGITANEANAVCHSSFGIPDRLLQLVLARQQQDLEKNRRRMKSRGAKECRGCGVLVVPVNEKPWTLDGTCSKMCCVRANGVATYSDIEPKLLAMAQQDNDPLQTRSLKNGKIPVKCGCGETMLVPRMYAGTMRPCPKCGARVHVEW